GLFGDREVARRHAEIEATPEGFRLRSYAPSGKTRVNGAVVDSQLLSDGDRIELGQTLLVFRRR
ncbi:FHA domain-containing protein, partial [Singulisphaera rosea]